ncbi:MAG: OmpA family protein [Flavobacteriaceae bacterium]|nr:OmpA family protein [Flavobacteriaceae bacterium]
MKRIFYILGIVLVILLGIYFQYRCCCGKTCSTSKTQKAVAVGTATGNLNGFSLKDGSFGIDCKDNFQFATSSYAIQEPVANNLLQPMDKLKTYLSENPNKGVNIKGLYGSFEENTSLFANLGLARANAVKSFFVKNGINKQQLAISSEVSETIKQGDALQKNAVVYDFFTEDESLHNQKLNDLKLFGENLKKEPLNLYFQTGGSNIDLTKEERETVERIGEYLSNFEDAKLLIVGHSDNTGKRQMNITLSKKRAEFVKDFFIKNGFLEQSIETSGMGPDKPIADNNTADGRAKNRRVAISIK